MLSPCSKTGENVCPKGGSEKQIREEEESDDAYDIEMNKSKRIWKKYNLEAIEQMCVSDKEWTAVNCALQQLYKELSSKIPIKQENNDEKSKIPKIENEGVISTIGKEEKDKEAAANEENLSEWLQCSLCLSLLVEPITLPCGHTFCRCCLIYAMQKCVKKCPHCRAVCHINPNTHSENVHLSFLVKSLFSTEYEERKIEIEKEKKKLKKVIPVFILNQLLFPGQYLSLHLFEPRYLHLINRVISADRHFAYLAKMSRGEGYEPRIGDVGLLVYVEECEFLPDGRCLLRAVGTQRIEIRDCWTENGTQGLWYAQYEEYLDQIGGILSQSEIPKEKGKKLCSINNSFYQLEIKWITTLEQFVNQIYKSPRLTVNALEDQIGSRVHLIYDPLNEEKNNLSQYSLFVSALFSLCTRNTQTLSCNLFKLRDPIQRIKILYEQLKD